MEDVNKGVARMQHNYGVDYSIPEMHKDKDLDWTGLDLNISGIMKENIPPPISRTSKPIILYRSSEFYETKCCGKGGWWTR